MYPFTRTNLVLQCVSVFLAGVMSSMSTTPEALTKKDHQHKGNELVIGQTLENLTVKFPYYVSGYDYEDRPIIVLPWGKWDIRSVAERGGKALRDFEEASDGFIHLIKDGYFERKLPNSSKPLKKGEYIGFGDFDGLDLRQLASIPSMTLFVTNLIKMASLNKEFAFGFMVNANPLAHHAINGAKPFIGSILERMEIYGTNRQSWIPQILKKLPRSQLPPAYGGEKDFQPISIFNMI